MRHLYSFLFYLILPFVLLRLLWKSRRLPAYRSRLAERLGFYPCRFDKTLWVHAVSVGEVIAAVPMIKALQETYPDLPLLVTTMTPTGAARVKAAFGESVKHAYIPYDLPDAAHRFLTTMKPVAGIIMETELWPNLFAACHDKGVPVCLLNARLSERSAKGYQRVRSLAKDMLAKVSLIAANSDADAKRFVSLGANSASIEVTGNIKFDLELPAEVLAQSKVWRASVGERFVWVAASTHAGEEAMVLAAHRQLRKKDPNALLILVPRHPDRFNEVASLCEASFNTMRRSQQTPVTAEVAVFLGDSMGEMLLYYGAADAVFVGGSLVPHGGHNFIEPAALGKPVLIGSHVRNFNEVSQLFLRDQALLKINSEAELVEHLVDLMQQPVLRQTMGSKAMQVVSANRGVLVKQLALVKALL